ncbi:MAG: flagellar biosynthesis protein FlhB [Thermodesulfatator sp.]|nr:MAG: flagellar biosynthesis protein FlhB [Thermodesulfatator sp.]
MAQESFQERTEQATPKRRREAREKGQVAKSKELASVAVLLSSLFTLYWGSSFFMTRLCSDVSYYLSHLASLNISINSLQSVALLGMKQFFILMAPLFAVITFIALLSNYLQVGTLFTWEPLIPRLSKINPMEGFKRLFSLQSLVEFIKSLFKLAIVTWIAWSTVRDQLELLPPLLDQTPYQIIAYLGTVSFKIFWKSCLAMILLSVLDYMYQRWEFERNLKMTKQEVKEEFKQTEGDPQVKSRIRSIQRELARKRMMQEVPEADVVITNPTHLAVALKYEAGKMEAPSVVAKGAGIIAEKIKEIARDNGIPIVENKPVAQSIFKLVEIGQTIPENLFQAVAEIFAYVYRLKGRKAGK